MMIYPRLRLFASALSLAFLAANCTVESGDDEDDETNCTPNETRECTCDNGAKGSQTCTPAGTRFSTCMCAGGTAGAGGMAGSGGIGGTPGAAGDSGAPGSGGTSDTGGTSGGGEGGTEGGAAGSGGTTEGGAGGTAGEGGGGGAGGANACASITPMDECNACILDQCCAEFIACTGACEAELGPMTECIEDARVTGTATPRDVGDCAETLANANWPSGLTPELVRLLNCMAGDTDDSSWPNQTSWAANSCRAGCFAQTP